jgi:LytS/YehU family sensor histidine kinase
VEIITRVDRDVLFITIRNNGQLKGNTEEDTGFGIKNTLQRLHLLYKDEAVLKISNESDTMVLTELQIPKQLVNEILFTKE